MPSTLQCTRPCVAVVLPVAMIDEAFEANCRDKWSLGLEASKAALQASEAVQQAGASLKAPGDGGDTLEQS